MREGFDPETIDLLRDVLERTWDQIPPDRKSTLTKSDVAAKILKRAADGERDPIRLKAAGLLSSVTVQL